MVSYFKDPQGLPRTPRVWTLSQGASAYLVPAFTTPAADPAWAETNLAIHRTAADLNGRAVERKPLVAFVAPDRIALRRHEAIVGPLEDIPISALYVQPTRLRPTHDGVEKLVAVCTFLDSARRCLRVPIIVGRVGAFGLVLTALGFDAFDSGLGEAESFDLSQLNRRPSRGKGSNRVRGSGRRVYLRRLITTLPARSVEALLSEQGVRSSFACNLPCCRWAGFDDLPARRWIHYLYTRLDEVGKLAKLPSALRIAELQTNLAAAMEHAKVASRVLRAHAVDPPSFRHLDTWDAVLARAATAAAA